MTDEDDDEDETEEFDLEEWKRKNEEKQEERLEKATYDWVETVREAGELYRDCEDKEAVSDKSDLSDETTEEALVVYGLIFDHPVEDISARTAIGGRSYFSLEGSVEDSLKDSDAERVQEIVREFVGAVYIQNDLDDQEVGDPPENSTPPSNVDLSKLSEMLSDSITSEMQEIANFSGISLIPDDLLATQSNQMANMVQPMIERRNRFVTSLAEDLLTQKQDMITQLLSSSFNPIIQDIQLQQDLLVDSFVNSIADLDFPDPLISDIASLQPSVSSAVGDYGWADSRTTGSSSSHSSTTADTESSETDSSTEYSPDSETSVTANPTNSELIWETSVEITKTLLNSGQVKGWFERLTKDKQIGVIQFILLSTVLIFTQNPAWAGALGLYSDIIRRVILSDEDEK